MHSDSALPSCQCQDWMEPDEKRLVLKHCCYWTRLHGATTTNSSKKRIWIPRSNELTSQAILNILNAERDSGLVPILGS
jgi:hypothetical protein